MWFYKFLDLPHIPDSLVEGALAQLYSKELFQMPQNDMQINWDHARNTMIHTDGVEKKNAPTISWDLEGEIVDWFRENVNKNFHNLRVSTTEPDGFLKDTQAAHRDLSRDYTLMYMVDSGGDNVRTAWYHEEGKPIVRGRGERCDDHRKLTLLAETVIPVRTWCLVNATVLHAVHNMVKPRRGIQAGFFSLDGLNIE
jgi:hypothetical protein